MCVRRHFAKDLFGRNWRALWTKLRPIQGQKEKGWVSFILAHDTIEGQLFKIAQINEKVKAMLNIIAQSDQGRKDVGFKDSRKKY